ncbi:globin domain-containing protein [Amycolatopsis endophytica]|uniref:globin domain-containing protein n=1 Tax=Amycolatopsis endophytica TaxID=860233 RepID=UPI0028B232DC|nr:globin domain-containing protein [Amycolatopsis endophytica]
MDVARLRASWSTVAERGDEFALSFYATLFLLRPALRELFEVSLTEQRGRFVAALGDIVSRVDDLDAAVPSLRRLGRAHRESGVLPEFYPLVGQALLATLERFLGDEWTPELAADWTGAYAVVAEVMTNAEVRGRGRQSVRLPLGDGDSGPRAELTADRVRGRLFRRARRYRRGFDREDVRAFQRRVAEEITARDREATRLRAEVARLRARSPREPTEGAAVVDELAVSLLSQAQLLAEETLTAADKHRRRLAAQAHRQAETAAEQAATTYRAAAGARYTPDGEELQRRLAWARTYSHALGMPLRAADTAFQHHLREIG